MADVLDEALLTLINGTHTMYLDSVMTTLTSGLTWIPLYVAIFWVVMKNNETVFQILLIVAAVAVCVMLCGGVDNLFVKPYFERLRPCNDPVFMEIVHAPRNILPSDYSFFSAHAANTFGIAVFLCLLVKSRRLSIAMLVWAATNSYTRLYLGVHFFTDVVAGMLYGTFVATIVYIAYRRIYKKMAVENIYISSQYTVSGYNRHDIDIVLFVLCATFMYSTIFI